MKKLLWLLLVAAVAHGQNTQVRGSAQLSGASCLSVNGNTPIPVCATPTASPVAGTYTTTQTVTLSTATPGAQICYTTNGATPTASVPGTCDSSSTPYAGPITVTATTTINAIATNIGDTNSPLFSGTYTIASGGQVAAPTFQVASGTVYPQPIRTVYGMQDDTQTGWGSCNGPACAGGTGTPSSTSQTIDNASPSLDGAAMLLSETTSEAYSNALWYDKQPAFCAATTFHSDFEIYPVSFTGVGSLEGDLFNFCAPYEYMWGMQWNQTAGVWDIWNQQTEQWVATTVTQGPVAGQWNRVEVWDHNVPGDTNQCNGEPCMYFDAISVNGTVYPLNMKEPAGPLPSGWVNNTGFQFQIDSDKTTTTSSTLSEYVDQASFTATNNGAWVNEATPGATLYYTIAEDGTTPPAPAYDSSTYLPAVNTTTFIAGVAGSGGMASGTLFVPDFEVWGPTTIKAMAAMPGMTDSAVSTASYSLAAPSGTAVTSCGYLPSGTGVYYLTGNLSCPTTGVQFSGANQYLDLNGYTINFGTANGALLTGTDANTTSGSTQVACTRCTTAMQGDRMVIDNYNLGGYQNNGGDGGLDSTIVSVSGGVATLSNAVQFTATGAEYTVWAPPVYGVLCDKGSYGGYNCNGSEVYNGTITEGATAPANSNAVEIQEPRDYPLHGDNTFAALTLNLAAPEGEGIFILDDNGLKGDEIAYNNILDSVSLIYARDGLPYPIKLDGVSKAGTSPEDWVHDNRVTGSPQGDVYAESTAWSVNNYFSNGPYQYANGFCEFFAVNNSRVTGDSCNGNTQGIEEEGGSNILEASRLNIVMQNPVHDPNHNMPGCELGFAYREKDFFGSVCPTGGYNVGSANPLGCGPGTTPGTGVLQNNVVQNNVFTPDSGACGVSAVEFTETYGNDTTLVKNNKIAINISTTNTANPNQLLSWDNTNAAGVTYTGNTYSFTGPYASQGFAGFFNYDQVINLTVNFNGVPNPAFTWRQGTNWGGCVGTGSNCYGINSQNLVLTGTGTPTCVKIPNTTLSSFEATFNGATMTCPQ